MLRKPEREKEGSPEEEESRSSGRLLDDIESLSKALALVKKPAASVRRHSLSAGGSYLPEARWKSEGPKRDLPPPPPPPTTTTTKEKRPSSSISSSSSSIWNWKPLRALSHIRHRRFDCRFTLQVHTVEGLPPTFDNSRLCVQWRRDAAAEIGLRTRSALVSHGAAEFEETLEHRCAVYGSRSGGLHHAARYEAKPYVLFAAAVGAPGLDLGEHRMDLTRLLPLTLEELEKESSGRWSTTFKLSGQARGGLLNVSFGFNLLDGSGHDRVPEPPLDGVDRESGLRRVGSLPAPSHESRGRLLLLPQSVDDVKVLHEIFPASVHVEELSVDRNSDDCSKPELKALTQEDESAVSRTDGMPHPMKSDLDEFLDPEFTVIEQGIEIVTKDVIKIHDDMVKHEDGRGFDEGERQHPPDEIAAGNDELIEIGKSLRLEPEESELSHAGSRAMASTEPDFDELSSAFQNLSILEPVVWESSKSEARSPEQYHLYEIESNCRVGKAEQSLSLDDATESVASEFLRVLGLDRSPSGLSSDSDPESPRGRLWKQFRQESLANTEDIFDLGMMEKEKEMDWKDFDDDFDLSSIVNAAEREHQRESQAMKSRARAKMLEDAEAEALMRELGLNERAFQHTPPGSPTGFGSPIELPPDDPLELPPLGDGLGHLVRTKDGGFLRSMDPLIFRFSKNCGSLIMQVSCPVVVPAEMGSGVMEILQSLGSMGIEKLSMQARMVMPLEDVAGKTMQQLAFERFADLFPWGLENGWFGFDAGAAGKRKTGGISYTCSSDCVSLEDLAPSAMEKLEALSIEGLRIQSGTSDEDVPSSVIYLTPGEISAFKGRGGQEVAAGLQLLDVRAKGDDADGLMCLAITLDEWMKLDSGMIDAEDLISDRTSKVLAAHHGNLPELAAGRWEGKNSGRKRGCLGNNLTVALMVQLRDPSRNHEPVGAPMLALIQVERVASDPVKNGAPGEEPDMEIINSSDNQEKGDEEEDEEDRGAAAPRFKITDVHVAGVKTDDPRGRRFWASSLQQQSGSRWLLASGMGRSGKHPLTKLRAAAGTGSSSPATSPLAGGGDTLWSISKRLHPAGGQWRELAALSPPTRNPNIILPRMPSAAMDLLPGPPR
ncbi:unnamed protein product [Spirodela intermedia]|uniref:C2 NT-type domain-containing protein n=1 Tax=Spirodela intermedia TaxID=51605 RepID=A0A7I8L0Y6_SPIIN|nr:unnamed protein product [Spirodela intermedia]